MDVGRGDSGDCGADWRVEDRSGGSQGEERGESLAARRLHAALAAPLPASAQPGAPTGFCSRFSGAWPSLGACDLVCSFML